MLSPLFFVCAGVQKPKPNYMNNKSITEKNRSEGYRNTTRK